MKMTYNREDDIALIELSPNGLIDHAEQSGPLIAHFAQDDTLVLLEILDASHFLTALMRVAMRGDNAVLVPGA